MIFFKMAVYNIIIVVYFIDVSLIYFVPHNAHSSVCVTRTPTLQCVSCYLLYYEKKKIACA
jgi:hypothetical protein